MRTALSQHHFALVGAIAFSLFVVTGCVSESSSSSDTSTSESTTDTTTDTSSDTDTDTSTDTTTEDTTDDTTDTDKDEDSVAVGSLDPDMFIEGALASTPEIVDCTLSDGTETTCYQIVSSGTPGEQVIGPFCPPTTTSSDEEGGIWLDGSGEVYQADGDFILNLANIYGDTAWNALHNADGSVNITDTEESCDGAAQPNVEEQYKYNCVECSMDYIDGGISATYLIPTTPVPADVTGTVSQVGVALTGIELSAAAPVEDILANYTIAAFDDCGGHINLHQGYHYHAATGCSEVGTQDDGHAGLLGYALDGYGIYGQLDSEGNEPEGLDECRGQTDETRGYHYHAASAGENMFIGCFHGKTVESTTDAGGPPGGLPPTGGPQG